jgi:hypothetical protein
MLGYCLRLLFIKPCEFGSGAVIYTQKFVKLGMKGQGIAPARSLNEKRHAPNNQSCDSIEIKRTPIERKPQHGVDNHREGGGMGGGLPDMGRPMPPSMRAGRSRELIVLGWRRFL